MYNRRRAATAHKATQNTQRHFGITFQATYYYIRLRVYLQSDENGDADYNITIIRLNVTSRSASGSNK